MAHETTAESEQVASSLALDPSISFSDYAMSTLTDPQPAWRTLNAARERAFTGEIKFHTAPAIHAYVDGGTVYYAERDGDDPLGQRLLAAGVLTVQQLDRGVVRVGDAEHLGRLFDRDQTIDRDAVMVVVEAETEALVSALASGAVAAVAVSAYRHHQSGVHRWFVAPMDSSLSRPVSDVAQVDRSVIDELPDVTPPVTKVRIEWDQPTLSNGSGLAAPTPLAADQPSIGDIDIEAELERFDADGADWASSADDFPDENNDSWLGDFQIVWPDGTEESATAAATASPTFDAASSVTLDAPDPEPLPLTPPASGLAPPKPMPAPFASEVKPASEAEAASEALAVADTGIHAGETDAPVEFAMPRIVIDSMPAPDAEVPHDVASAVRRALQAIENAGSQPAELPHIDLAPLTLPDLKLPTLEEAAREHTTPAARVEPALQPSPTQPGALQPPAPVPLGGFAPPTADTRAEAIYARAAAAAGVVADAGTVDTSAADAADTEASPELNPEPGQASVVFVDDDGDGGSRKGALRRLIGSLRKD